MRSIARGAVRCPPAAACLCSSRAVLACTPQLKQRRESKYTCSNSEASSTCQIGSKTTPRAAAVVAAAATAATTGSTVSQPAPEGASSSDWRSLLITKSIALGQLVKLTLKAKIKGDTGLVNIKPAAGQQQAPAAAIDGSSSSSSGVNGDTGSMPYKQLTMRPVMLKGKVMLQLSLLTARQVRHAACISLHQPARTTAVFKSLSLWLSFLIFCWGTLVCF